MPAFSIVCHLHKQITTASSSLLLLHALSSCVANSNTVPINEVLQDSSRSTPCFLGVGACSEQPCSKQQHRPSQRGAPGRRLLLLHALGGRVAHSNTFPVNEVLQEGVDKVRPARVAARNAST